MRKNKEPIRLRQKHLANGNISLYLDIYCNGSRSYEFLKLYLIPERTRADRETNRSTLALANSVKAKRILEIQNGGFGFRPHANDDVYFFDYYRKMCEKRLNSGESRGNWGNWYSALKHMLIYEKNERIRFKDISKEWIEGFKTYLETAKCYTGGYVKDKGKVLSRNSKVSYFRKLRACINQAYDDGIISKNPMRGIDGFAPEEGVRMYLTIDELKILAKTECDYPNIKRAFLFSCLTGLRRSDIINLKWRDVSEMSGFTRLIFKQVKTGGQEYLDITPQAAELMGERGDDDESVFGNIHTTGSTNDCIRRWVLMAGIKKDITFHSGRHTFATMMLDIGTDIYVVSKLLGHKQLQTTQIYTKVLDKNKQAAVNNIPDIL